MQQLVAPGMFRTALHWLGKGIALALVLEQEWLC